MKFFVVLILLVSSLPAFANADAWPSNTIGDGFGVAAKPERTGYEQLKKIKDAGFSYVRYDMYWHEVEFEHGVYQWAAFDRFIASLRKFHLKSVIILDGTNPLYSGQVDVPPEAAFGHSTITAAPTGDEAARAYANFATAAIKRYGTDDIIWELWNEPDTVAFWPPKPDPVAFSTFANAVCKAMRTAAPQAKIIGPAVARFPSLTDILHREFFETFIQSQVKDCLNAISVHPYRRERNPETVISDYNKKVRAFIKQYALPDTPPLPVVNSEWGYSLTETSPELQGQYALRIRLSDMLANVPLTILYEWQDSANMSDDREQHFGLVDSDGDFKDSGKVVNELLPLIKDATIVRRLPVSDPDCYVVLLHQPDGRSQLLAWMGLQKLEHKVTLTVKDQNDDTPSSYVLSLGPQLITIRSPDDAVTVIKD